MTKELERFKREMNIELDKYELKKGDTPCDISAIITEMRDVISNFTRRFHGDKSVKLVDET